jgi:hypothetical protein
MELAFCLPGGKRPATWLERARHQHPQISFLLNRLRPRPGTGVKLARTVQCSSIDAMRREVREPPWKGAIS